MPDSANLAERFLMKAFDEIIEILHDQTRLLHLILKGINSNVNKAISATLNAQGDKMNPQFTILLLGAGASLAPPAYQEWDGPNGTGNEVTPVGPLSYASSNSAIATVDSNGNVAAVAVGQCTMTVTDAGNGLTASQICNVVDTAVSATLQATVNPLPVVAPAAPVAAAVKAAPAVVAAK